MRVKIGLAALCFVVLTGFTACEERRPPPPQITVSESLLQECPDIVRFSDAKSDGSSGSHLEYTTELMTQYTLCRVSKTGLNKAVRKIIEQKKVD